MYLLQISKYNRRLSNKQNHLTRHEFIGDNGHGFFKA